MKIAVLGCGMVGHTIALDLAYQHDVTAIDASEQSLSLLSENKLNIRTVQMDILDNTEVQALWEDFEIVISAVPGFIGFRVLKSVIQAGKNVIDISFFPEDAMELNALAKQKNVTAIVDCGVAPGMSNFVLGHYNEIMQVQSFECYVGGLPKRRTKPFEYKAPFSPVDVIEEYTRPARLKENGKIVIKPAMTDIELMDFEETGTLESFNTDGLRSLLYTMPHIPDMKEKTLRYPGHAALIIALQRSGFFSKEPVQFKGKEFVPLELTSSVLFNDWKLQPGEEEITIMKVIIKGFQNGEAKTVEYSLFDEYDSETKTSSMSRTTGYTCTAAANAFANGLFTEKGVFPPELVAKSKPFYNYIFNYLRQRNVIWKKREY